MSLRKIVLKIFKGVPREDHEKALDNENSFIDEYSGLITKAERLIEQAKYRNFTTVQIFDSESEPYLLALKEIFDTPEFIYFIDVHKRYCIMETMEGDNAKGIEMQGVLKGIDYIMKNLYVAKKRYLELKSNQNVEI